jgi:hypothetical protein
MWRKKSSKNKMTLLRYGNFVFFWQLTARESRSIPRCLLFLYHKILTIILIDKDTSVCNGTKESLQSLITWTNSILIYHNYNIWRCLIKFQSIRICANEKKKKSSFFIERNEEYIKCVFRLLISHRSMTETSTN